MRSGECDVAVGSRFVHGDGYEPRRYKPSPARVVGTSLLRRAMRVALGRPFRDATSGMYAVNAKAMPISRKPYEAGAPEVEGLLRLQDAGLRVEEIPVDMRERASGESKLAGKKAAPPRAHGHRHALRVPARAQALRGGKNAFAHLRRLATLLYMCLTGRCE